MEGFLIWFDFEAMLTMMKGDVNNYLDYVILKFESMFRRLVVARERVFFLEA
jgi:hypothetical protein